MARSLVLLLFTLAAQKAASFVIATSNCGDYNDRVTGEACVACPMVNFEIQGTDGLSTWYPVCSALDPIYGGNSYNNAAEYGTLCVARDTCGGGISYNGDLTTGPYWWLTNNLCSESAQYIAEVVPSSEPFTPAISCPTAAPVAAPTGGSGVFSVGDPHLHLAKGGKTVKMLP